MQEESRILESEMPWPPRRTAGERTNRFRRPAGSGSSQFANRVCGRPLNGLALRSFLDSVSRIGKLLVYSPGTLMEVGWHVPKQFALRFTVLSGPCRFAGFYLSWKAAIAYTLSTRRTSLSIPRP